MAKEPRALKTGAAKDSLDRSSESGTSLLPLRAEQVDASYVVGPSRFGRLFKRSREWGRRRLKEWAEEQEKGGPIRVYKNRAGGLFTTIGIVNHYMPRHDVFERRFCALERDLLLVFTRLAEIERRLSSPRR